MAIKTLAASDVRQSTLERVERLKPESKARWGRMTAHQMICHLDDSFGLALGEKQASLATGPLQRTLVKWLALRVPVPWPHGTPTRPEMEQGRGGTPPVEFDRDRSRLVWSIGRFCDRQGRFGAYLHPIFGQLREDEWLRWGYLHTDHHLRQFGV